MRSGVDVKTGSRLAALPVGGSASDSDDVTFNAHTTCSPTLRLWHHLKTVGFRITMKLTRNLSESCDLKFFVGFANVDTPRASR